MPRDVLREQFAANTNSLFLMIWQTSAAYLLSASMYAFTSVVTGAPPGDNTTYMVIDTKFTTRCISRSRL
jgi:hypothetical protein